MKILINNIDHFSDDLIKKIMINQILKILKSENLITEYQYRMSIVEL